MTCLLCCHRTRPEGPESKQKRENMLVLLFSPHCLAQTCAQGEANAYCGGHEQAPATFTDGVDGAAKVSVAAPCKISSFPKLPTLARLFAWQCMHFCRTSPCLHLNGNTADECSGCALHYQCRPGAPGYGSPASRTPRLHGSSGDAPPPDSARIGSASPSSSTPVRRDYYGILKLKKTATAKQIEAALKTAADKWRPEKHKRSNEEMKAKAARNLRLVMRAHEVLRDRDLRAAYDRGVDVDADSITSGDNSRR